MFSSKCSSGHVKCSFDDSVEKFHRSSMSFGSKCIFLQLLKYFRQEFNKFCLKNQTKLKNHHVFDENSSKSSRDAKNAISTKMTKFFFQSYYFFSLESEIQKNLWEPFTRKPKKSFGHVECTFGNAAENFSQRSGQLSLKVRKLSKISENMIIFLKVVHWTRRKQFWHFCWKLFAVSSRHFASKSKLNLKTKNCFWKKSPQKVLRRLKCNIDKTDETFFSELRFLSLEPEVKQNMTNYCEKKSRSSLET